VPIEYQGETFSEGFRADLIVGDLFIVELKSIERVTPAHKKQLLTYLRLTGLKLGYLLNFGEASCPTESTEPSTVPSIANFRVL
jgi:GxxExxY protein